MTTPVANKPTVLKAGVLLALAVLTVLPAVASPTETISKGNLVVSFEVPDDFGLKKSGPTSRSYELKRASGARFSLQISIISPEQMRDGVLAVSEKLSSLVAETLKPVLNDYRVLLHSGSRPAILGIDKYTAQGTSKYLPTSEEPNGEQIFWINLLDSRTLASPFGIRSVFVTSEGLLLIDAYLFDQSVLASLDQYGQIQGKYLVVSDLSIVDSIQKDIVSGEGSPVKTLRELGVITERFLKHVSIRDSGDTK